MPLFAFANAGVSLEGLSLGSLLDKVPLGIVLGLFVGKQLGVFVFSYISIKLKIAQIDKGESLTDRESLQILKSSAKQLNHSQDYSEISIHHLIF